jgi:NADH:ubiquinone oxidoreductase subunit 5 (subunit L)/multisubunit Na+/H+ antiporter MnhA subunit
MFGDTRLFEFLYIISIFVSGMVLLVEASSSFWFLTYWEVIGVCSFLLISFWSMRLAAVRSGLQAILVNKVGDTFLVLGFVLFFLYNCTDIFLLDFWIYGYINYIFGFVILGVLSKSAVVFFHYWLPYAMEGPTPVSALIHAATLVTAGLFLVVKLRFLLLNGFMCSILLILGLIGVVLLAMIAIDQFDVKKLIAYSTLSQISFMLLVLVFGDFNTGILYILVHAVFKSLMFMASGNLIHGLSDQQDLRIFGGLAKVFSVSYLFIFYACVAMNGVIGSIGFYSKDLIVEWIGNAYIINASFIHISLLIGLSMTFLYSAYLVYRVFLGIGGRWSFSRSNDDVGLYLTIILLMQTWIIYVGGSYFASNLNFNISGLHVNYLNNLSDVLISNEDYSFSEYSFTVITVFLLLLFRYEYSYLAGLRIFSYKFFYDKIVNSILLRLHELSNIMNADLLRLMFYTRYSISSSKNTYVVRQSIMRIIVCIGIVCLVV